MVAEMTAGELRDALEHNTPPIIIDVREPWEYTTAHIEGAELIPLNKLATEIQSRHPNKSEPVVLYCDLGIRSQHGATLLRSLGYKNVVDLEGGMNAYSGGPLPKPWMIA